MAAIPYNKAMDMAPFPCVDGIHTLTVPLPGFPDLMCSNMFVLGNGPVTLIDPFLPWKDS